MRCRIHARRTVLLDRPRGHTMHNLIIAFLEGVLCVILATIHSMQHCSRVAHSNPFAHILAFFPGNDEMGGKLVEASVFCCQSNHAFLVSTVCIKNYKLE